MLSLKDTLYKYFESPIVYKKIKHIKGCPCNLAEPFLRLLSHHQLLQVEANTPGLERDTQNLWRMHTLKQFPNIGETHEISGEAAQDADWRATFEDLTQDRREREQAARERLKANYGKIADGKSERAIQIIKREAPVGRGPRNKVSALGTARSSLGLKSARPGPTILTKALKGAMSSTTRPSNTKIPPRPNESRVMQKSTLPTTNTAPRPSKFLLPTVKK